MASAGAKCNHVNHVTTQLPYALLAAVMSFISYFVAGILSIWSVKWYVTLPISIVLMLAVLFVVRFIKKRNPDSYANADVSRASS